MGSREREQSPARHQPHLSSLVVRPSESGGGGSDYEPGEVRRDPPPYSRSDRYLEDPPGHGKRAGSVSPIRHRKVDHHYRDDFVDLDGPHHIRGFRGGRGPGRFRDLSPPYDRGRGGRRFSGRGFDRSGFDHDGPFISRNNPNVAPREGDWICPEPTCGNLNFARRDFCNNCNRPRPRIRSGDSPPRNFLGPPPRFAGPIIDRSPERAVNGYRSPPRGWGRDGPRDFGPHPKHGGRFPDYPLRRERLDYREEEDYRDRDRGRFDRALPPLEWGPRDRGRDSFHERRGGYNVKSDRRPLSPMPPQPLPPPPALAPRGQWARDIRERSRSPVRSGPPAKDRRRDSFIDRGRDGRWGGGRDRFDNRPY